MELFLSFFTYESMFNTLHKYLCLDFEGVLCHLNFNHLISTINWSVFTGIKSCLKDFLIRICKKANAYVQSKVQDLTWIMKNLDLGD